MSAFMVVFLILKFVPISSESTDIRNWHEGSHYFCINSNPKKGVFEIMHLDKWRHLCPKLIIIISLHLKKTFDHEMHFIPNRIPVETKIIF